MNTIKSIGGYFELEIPKLKEYHKDAIALNTGRNCLEYILRVRGYKHVYIPYYTCDVILEPLKKLGVDHSFYHIDKNLELAEDVVLRPNEALLATNYFGLKQEHMLKLAAIYGNQLIIDNTQAFFDKPIDGIDTFYSCRKYFGVPDGAYLYTDKLLPEALEQEKSYDRMSQLLKRIDISAEDGFVDFQKADESLGNQPIRKMSKLTQRIMQSIHFETVKKKRRSNYQTLLNALSNVNNLKLEFNEEVVPMVYPLLLTSINGLREKLIKNKIFVARYWQNVLEWTSKDDLEHLFAYHLIPLPIDQRYGEVEMYFILEMIK